MKCVVNWIPLRIRVRSRNTQPHLNLSKQEEKNFQKYERHPDLRYQLPREKRDRAVLSIIQT